MTSKDDGVGGAAEVLRWLIYETGVPGELGRAVAFSGVDSQGRPARVTPRGNDLELSVEGDPPLILHPGSLLARMTEGDLQLDEVHVVRDLAPFLFKAAVREAERSLGELGGAASALDKAETERVEGEAVFWHVMAGHHQDEASQSSVVSIVMSIATVEAQLNVWAAAGGGWGLDGAGRDRDKSSIKEKCLLLGELTTGCVSEPDFGRHPMQDLLFAVAERDSYVHPKAEPIAVPIAATTTPPAAVDRARRAREVCSLVRESTILMSTILGVDPPRYLAMCPSTGPDDIDAWRSAILMTGTRDDPIFPPILPSPS